MVPNLWDTVWLIFLYCIVDRENDYLISFHRYPFNDSEHASLFAKITRGHFIIPDCLSSRAKCLIRSLLRRAPSERLSAADVLLHPWLTHEEQVETSLRGDQIVPNMRLNETFIKKNCTALPWLKQAQEMYFQIMVCIIWTTPSLLDKLQYYQNKNYGYVLPAVLNFHQD
jgi:serine/threonine protein kinase